MPEAVAMIASRPPPIPTPASELDPWPKRLMKRGGIAARASAPRSSGLRHGAALAVERRRQHVGNLSGRTILDVRALQHEHQLPVAQQRDGRRRWTVASEVTPCA